MTVDDLKTLFAYSSWANASLRDVVSGLTTEQFTRQVAGSYGSIRNTMVHMLSAEWGWLERCGGAREARPSMRGTIQPRHPCSNGGGTSKSPFTASSRAFGTTISIGWWSSQSVAAPGSPCRLDNCCITRLFTTSIIGARSRCL